MTVEVELLGDSRLGQGKCSLPPRVHRNREGVSRPSVDLTPHVVTGAAIGARAKWPIAGLTAAFASHFVLDAIPHFHVAWITGKGPWPVVDAGLGFLLAGAIALRVRSLWPVVTGVAAILPEAPGLRGRLEGLLSGILPHPIWPPPWGIMTQMIIVVVAFIWGMRTMTGTE